MTLRAAFLAIAVLLTSLNSSAQTPTWSSEIASVVYAKCTPCHRTGEIAPFSLSSYDEAAAFAGSIKHAVQTREMPPWPPAAGHGTFMGNRSLSEDEIAKISAWVDAGAPSGDLSQVPKPPTFPSGSQLGTPDLVLEMQETWQVQGNSKDVYRYFVLPTSLLEDRYISAIEFRPGNTKVVHHVLYYLDTTGTARAKDLADPLPGYSGFGDPGFESAASFLGWVPGAQMRFYPPEIGVRFRKNSDLVIQVHYAPSEEAQTDRSHVNIFFHKNPVTRLVQEFSLNPINLVPGQNFVIPANTTKSFTTRFTVPLDVSLVGVAPHMHLLGKNARAYAVTPQSDTINLVKINDWDFHWQGGYAYRNPVRVPRGSTLYYTAEYDNTINNLENPNSPPKTVRWGESTTDEMLLCYFHWVVYLPGDEAMDMETTIPTSVSEGANTSSTHISVYPNPSAERVNISVELSSSARYWLEIVDASGNVVRRESQPRAMDGGLNVISVDTRGLSSGGYIVRLSGDHSSLTSTFVVRH